MHALIAKIARLAVSKAAAFCYAVAVGVAGNIVFNFVQHHQLPAVTVPSDAGHAGSAAPAAAVIATAVSAIPGNPAQPAPIATPSLPPEKPAAPRPTTVAAAPTSVPILPEPPPAVLPNPDALPAPALRPAALPPRKSSAPASDTRAMPDEAASAPVPASAAANVAALSNAAVQPAENQSRTPLPSVGEPIEVAEPPAPPARAVAAVSPLPSTRAPTPGMLPPSTRAAKNPTPLRFPDPPPPSLQARSAEPTPSRQSFEFSDFWHPVRAAGRGLHWAGEQLPVFGGNAAEARAEGPVPAAPISLLPEASAANAPDGEKGSPAAPVRPGPGSGGLY